MIRRTPLKRGTKRIPQRRATPRRTTAKRDGDYMEWIRGRKCLVCMETKGSDATRYGSDPAHTRINGRGSKGDDSSCVPLCREHHAELHQRGGKDFEAKYRIDLAAEAVTYYGIYTTFGRVN